MDAYKEPGRYTAQQRSPSLTELALQMESSSNLPRHVITAKASHLQSKGDNFNSTQKVQTTIEALLPTHSTLRPYAYGPKKTPNL